MDAITLNRLKSKLDDAIRVFSVPGLTNSQVEDAQFEASIAFSLYKDYIREQPGADTVISAYRQKLSPLLHLDS